MTPDLAQGILNGYLSRFDGMSINEIAGLKREAKGFLQGVAYQEEKAKGLVEALGEALKIVEAKSSGCRCRPGFHCLACRAKEVAPNLRNALAHYRQGQLNEK